MKVGTKVLLAAYGRVGKVVDVRGECLAVKVGRHVLEVHEDEIDNRTCQACGESFPNRGAVGDRNTCDRCLRSLKKFVMSRW
jgi:hypothetical protein